MQVLEPRPLRGGWRWTASPRQKLLVMYVLEMEVVGLVVGDWIRGGVDRLVIYVT